MAKKSSKKKVQRPRHPIQPLVLEDEILRFKRNNAVHALYELCVNNGIDVRAVLMQNKAVTKDDWCQFSQLIGTSHSAAGNLPYVDQQTLESALVTYKTGVTELEARNAVLEYRHRRLTMRTRKLAAEIFDVQPDDLEER